MILDVAALAASEPAALSATETTIDRVVVGTAPVSRADTTAETPWVIAKLEAVAVIAAMLVEADEPALEAAEEACKPALEALEAALIAEHMALFAINAALSATEAAEVCAATAVAIEVILEGVLPVPLGYVVNVLPESDPPRAVFKSLRRSLKPFVTGWVLIILDAIVRVLLP